MSFHHPPDIYAHILEPPVVAKLRSTSEKGRQDLGALVRGNRCCVVGGAVGALGERPVLRGKMRTEKWALGRRRLSLPLDLCGEDLGGLGSVRRCISSQGLL